MGVSLASQTVSFMYSALIGVGLAVLYDLLGGFRRRGGFGAAAVCDVLFSMVFGLSLFAFAMGACGGSLRLYSFAGVTLGGAAWFLTLGPLLRPVFDFFARAAAFLARSVLAPFALFAILIKKFWKSQKNSFHFHYKWYKISENDTKRSEVRRK